VNRPNLKNNTILIVGGAGFIGSTLADKLIESANSNIIIVDNLFSGRKENLSLAINNGATLYIDDLEFDGTLDYIFNNHDIDIVFNCATKPLNYSFINPSSAYMTNLTVLKNLLEFQRKNAFSTLCHFSSSEVYGSALFERMDEQHPLNPTTTYAAGKSAADLLLQSYVRMFNLDAFIVRPFNNYGPRQNFEGPLAGVIPVTIKKILEGKAPEIHGSGKQTRDFIFVEDTVHLVTKVFPLIPAGECVNITNDQQLSVEEVIDTIVEAMGYTGEIIKKKERKSDVINHRGSNKKLESLVGGIQKTNFKEGIERTINWIKNEIK